MKPIHYQTGRGTLCSLDNDASIRTHTEDESTVTCFYCRYQLRLKKEAALRKAGLLPASE